jgi:CBS domain-containing protein
MLVSDLMAREVVTLDAGEKLDLAEGIMRLGRIRHLPVVSAGKLVGVLSQRDLFHAAISTVLQLRRSAERDWLATIPVREAMSEPVVTIAPQASLREAVELMAQKKIGCLPVVDGTKLVGLLSESDCMQYLARLLAISGEKLDLPEAPSN